ncbi:uncharacterized protein LOC119769286 [Culex quinquefasciatus]|uniref:uncharacterized protein LOC119769286 n=1 Tax=Culex quinquefasciatus TaxID=7176 RepID=UPI0018E39AE1|nr:uncharacterized protein LOC119769286 [Culex quinquefasciatus]
MLETLDYKYIDALTCTSLLQEEFILIKDYKDEDGLILKKGARVVALGKEFILIKDYKDEDGLILKKGARVVALGKEFILIKDYKDEDGLILKKGARVVALGRTADSKLEQVGYATSDGRSRTYLPLAVLGRYQPPPTPVCAIGYCTRSGPVYKCTGAIKLDR